MAEATAPKAEATQKKVPKGAKEYQAVILAEDMSEDMSKDAVSYTRVYSLIFFPHYPLILFY